MALSIKNFLNFKSLSTIETTLGTLCIFPMSVGEQESLLKKLGAPIETIQPRDYLKELLIYVCHPQSAINQDNHKPTEPTLTTHEINNFSDDELEVIAETYININDYLFKKRIHTNIKNNDGKIVSHSKLGGIEHPKNENESQVDYLHRLSCIEQEKRNELMSSFLKSMPKFNTFSNSLSNDIKESLRLGEALMGSIPKGIKIPDLEFKRTTSTLDCLDFQELERRKEERRRAPFNDLAKRLDELIDAASKSTEFMVVANKIQTNIADEIKSGGNSTDRHARKNLFLSYIVIGLTIFSLLLTAWPLISAVLSPQKSMIDISPTQTTSSLEKNEQTSERMFLKIIAELRNIKEEIRSSNSGEERTKQDIELLKIENEKYKKELLHLSQELHRLKSQQNK